MTNLQKGKYFALGVIMTFFVVNLFVPTLAALIEKTITVSTGVNIYVDDIKLDPKDANGNPVETFIYNGTTYLPVRAIAGAFNTEVSWDDATQSVYIGDTQRIKGNLRLVDMDGNTILDKRDMIYADVEDDNVIVVALTNNGKQKFAEATERISKQENNFISIYLDEDVLSMPAVHDKIDAQYFMITGISGDAADELVRKINEGI